MAKQGKVRTVGDEVKLAGRPSAAQPDTRSRGQITPIGSEVQLDTTPSRVWSDVRGGNYNLIGNSVDLSTAMTAPWEGMQYSQGNQQAHRNVVGGSRRRK